MSTISEELVIDPRLINEEVAIKTARSIRMPQMSVHEDIRAPFACYLHIYTGQDAYEEPLIRVVVGKDEADAAKWARVIAGRLLKDGVFTFPIEEHMTFNQEKNRPGFDPGIDFAARRISAINIAKEKEEQKRERLGDPEGYKPLLLWMYADQVCVND